MMTGPVMACTLSDESDSPADQAVYLAMALRALDQCRLRHGLSPFEPQPACLALVFVCRHSSSSPVCGPLSQSPQPAWTGLRRTPMPSIDTSTTSPAFIAATPRGVPVLIRSPGNRVMHWDR